MTVYPFICVEGIDGTGKSTVAREAARRLNGIYYKTPPEPFSGIRQVVDRVSDPYARALYYVAAVAYAATEIHCLCEIAPVVCDRYIFSTIAYHEVLAPEVGAAVRSLPFDPPDHSFLLVAEESERLRRLEERAKQLELPPLNRDYDSGFLARVQEKFLGLGLTLIDTTHATSDEVAALIADRVAATTGVNR